MSISIGNLRPCTNEAIPRRRQRRKEQQARLHRFKAYGKEAKHRKNGAQQLSAFKRVQMLLAEVAADEQRKSFADSTDIIPVPAAMVSSQHHEIIKWPSSPSPPNTATGISQEGRTNCRRLRRQIDIVLLTSLQSPFEYLLPARWRILHDESSSEHRLYRVRRWSRECSSHWRCLWTGERIPLSTSTRPTFMFRSAFIE
jgi:hypothetical protein